MQKIFSPDSIWNRPVPATAKFADISDALWQFSPPDSPARFYLDLITVIKTDPAAPLAAFGLNSGFNYPGRATPRAGRNLYYRPIAANGGMAEASQFSNGILIIYDPATGAIDEGGAFWRGSVGGDILIEQDRPALHYKIKDSGLLPGAGGVRGSGLSGLGGAIQAGEINGEITHALAFLTSGALYSKTKGYVWPASRCDQIWKDPNYGYKGPNPAYALGTLLAIPSSVNVETLQFKTAQGRVVARAAQKYGLYVADSTAAAGNRFALSMEYQAAINDLGLVVNHANGYQSVGKISGNDFQADMLTILHLVQAVANNA